MHTPTTKHVSRDYPAQTENASGFQWKVRSVQEGREKAQGGKEMAVRRGRLVAGGTGVEGPQGSQAGQAEPAFQPWCDHMLLTVICTASTLPLIVESFSASQCSL